MAVDIYASRRTNYHKIYWWKSDKKSNFELGDIVYSKAPSGFFYASESNPIQTRNDMLNGVFKVDKNTTMLKTMDDVKGINVDDIVEYHDKKWIIVDIQQTHIHKQEEFGRKITNITYFTIRS